MQRKRASDFDPRILEIFDGDVHGRISERAFIAQAGHYAAVGARALCFLQGERNTSIRVHGTVASAPIDSSAFNGCFRMYDSHVIDLYERVPLGALVVVS